MTKKKRKEGNIKKEERKMKVSRFAYKRYRCKDRERAYFDDKR